jgi:hypothetical protein
MPHGGRGDLPGRRGERILIHLEVEPDYESAIYPVEAHLVVGQAHEPSVPCQVGVELQLGSGGASVGIVSDHRAALVRAGRAGAAASRALKTATRAPQTWRHIGPVHKAPAKLTVTRGGAAAVADRLSSRPRPCLPARACAPSNWPSPASRTSTTGYVPARRSGSTPRPSRAASAYLLNLESPSRIAVPPRPGPR